MKTKEEFLTAFLDGHIPAGIYEFNGVLEIDGIEDHEVRADDRARLRMADGSGYHMLILSNCRNLRVHGLKIDANSRGQNYTEDSTGEVFGTGVVGERLPNRGVVTLLDCSNCHIHDSILTNVVLDGLVALRSTGSFTDCSGVFQASTTKQDIYAQMFKFRPSRDGAWFRFVRCYSAGANVAYSAQDNDRSPDADDRFFDSVLTVEDCTAIGSKQCDFQNEGVERVYVINPDFRSKRPDMQNDGVQPYDNFKCRGNDYVFVMGGTITGRINGNRTNDGKHGAIIGTRIPHGQVVNWFETIGVELVGGATISGTAGGEKGTVRI